MAPYRQHINVWIWFFGAAPVGFGAGRVRHNSKPSWDTTSEPTRFAGLISGHDVATRAGQSTLCTTQGRPPSNKTTGPTRR